MSSIIQHLMQTKLIMSLAYGMYNITVMLHGITKRQFLCNCLPSGALVDDHAVKCYSRWSVAECECFYNGVHVRKSTVWVFVGETAAVNVCVQNIVIWNELCRGTCISESVIQSLHMTKSAKLSYVICSKCVSFRL